LSSLFDLKSSTLSWMQSASLHRAPPFLGTCYLILQF
jgi:hypothetical protein